MEQQTDIERLVETADLRSLYINQRNHAKERFKMLNSLSWEGHTFELTPGFIGYALLQYMSATSDDESAPVVLLDKNDEPCLVEDMALFIDRMQEAHTEALNEYYDTCERLRLAKTSQELVERR